MFDGKSYGKYRFLIYATLLEFGCFLEQPINWPQKRLSRYLHSLGSDREKVLRVIQLSCKMHATDSVTDDLTTGSIGMTRLNILTHMTSYV
jgi:hypothetical protein